MERNAITGYLEANNTSRDVRYLQYNDNTNISLLVRRTPKPAEARRGGVV